MSQARRGDGDGDCDCDCDRLTLLGVWLLHSHGLDQGPPAHMI
jgi:hypothetical protein